MNTSTKNHSTLRTSLIITALLVGLILVLTTLASHAQSRLTYGLEAGGGTSKIYMTNSYGNLHWVRGEYELLLRSYDVNYCYRALRLGSYARYYFVPTFYLQSGVYYTTGGGREGFTKSMVLPSGTDPSGLCPPGGCIETRQDNNIRYQFHQVEVPLLAGVRFAQQLRLYAGPVWSFLLKDDIEIDIHEPHRTAIDPTFVSVRAGIGADMRRLSLDVAFQGAVGNNTSYWEATVPDPTPFGNGHSIIGGRNLGIESFFMTLGYRLR